MNRKKIGIMGGTFNPIHYGHLMLADHAQHQFALDEVWFMPTGHTAYKEFSGAEMIEHRCNMVKLAIADNPKFALSRMEVDNTDVNYTYLTLQKLHELHPDHEYYFILGADSLFDFQDWKEPAQIVREASILVAVRDELDEEKVDAHMKYLSEELNGVFYRLNSPNFSVSSKNIRARIKEGNTIRYMMPDAVIDYMNEHKLYR